MANSKFFTNTYITGSGRQNYLRADYLEDPLFTSFTFDIDFISSPLFYTIKNYEFSKDIGISEQIEIALGEMRGRMFPDQGYDILPLLSAEFLNGNKLGFGLQQNVYTDLPLYGATEYIYMVDKRNGDGSQNDVRFNSSGSVDGSSSSGNNSYKLGDSVRSAVSESDAAWAANQIEQANEQIVECDKIISETEEQHNRDGETLKELLNACNITKAVEGEEKYLTEEELQKKVDEYMMKGKEYESFKGDIANWVNGELTAFQNRMTALFNQNECVKKLISFDDSTKEANKTEMIERFGDKWVENFLWKKDGDSTYIMKSLKEYNKIETYVNVPGAYSQSYKPDDNQSLLLEKKSGDGEVTVRPSKIVEKYKDKLIWLGLMKDGEEFNREVKVKILKDAPTWTTEIPARVSYWTNNAISTDFCKTVIVNPLRYKCDPDVSFVDFDSEAYTKNNELLGKYQAALDELRGELYGSSDRGKSNPTEDSLYGQYLSAKNKYDNDAYSQAVRTRDIAKSGVVENSVVVIDNEQNTSNNNSNEIPAAIPQSSDTVFSETLIAPQTVLDMLGFISGMRKMTIEYPYVIQGITGLDKAYENNYGIKDPFMGSGDNKITLTCWESLDLRVTSMFNRYFNAVYDRQYRRERVPVNLRRFNCSVYVHDVRNFVAKSSDSKYINRLLELTDMYYSAIEFKFYDCEIVPEETGNIFSDISNEAPSEMKKTNFTFTYGNCVINFITPSEVSAYRRK